MRSAREQGPEILVRYFLLRAECNDATRDHLLSLCRLYGIKVSKKSPTKLTYAMALLAHFFPQLDAEAKSERVST